MRCSYSLPAEVALAVLLSSCAPSLPTAPDLGPVLQAYENPTVDVGREIMEEWADDIAEAAEGIENSEIFQEILDLITEVQMELEASTAKACNGGANNGKDCANDDGCPDGTCDATGDLRFGAKCSGGTNDGGDCATNADCPADPDASMNDPPPTCDGGAAFPSPTGAIRLNYICPGWDERQFDDGYVDSPNRANGSVGLNVTLDSGGIGRVVWGTAANCLYLVPNDEGNCEPPGCDQASYDGGIAVDLGPDWVDADIEMLPVTFVVDGTIVVADDDFPINQSFRVILAVESGLEILVDISDPALSQPPLSQTFNYIFAGDIQLIRDASRLFGCSLELSYCFEQICVGGANDGRACTNGADCPEGICEERELFSW